MHDRRFGGLFWGTAALLMVGAVWSLVSIARSPSTTKRAATTSSSVKSPIRQKHGTSTTSSTSTTLDPFVASYGTVGFTVVNPGRKDVPASTKKGCALLATTTKQLENGLMGRSDLAGFDAMVFRFDRNLIAGFYMKNVKAPLNIAWFDSNGKIVGATTMPVCPPQIKDCPTFKPGAAFRTAMETFDGGMSKLGVGTGSVITYTGTCSPSA